MISFKTSLASFSGRGQFTSRQSVNIPVVVVVIVVVVVAVVVVDVFVVVVELCKKRAYS